MIRNYIEFKYDEDGYLIAKVSRDGKYRIIRNIDNIFKLMDIAEKHNYTIEGEMRIVRDARYIIDEYDKSKRKRSNKFHLYNKVKDNMVIKRKHTVGKKIAAISLAVSMAFAGAMIAKSNAEDTDDSEIVKGQYIVTDLSPDDYSNYSDYLENIEYEETEPTTEKSESTTAKKETKPTEEINDMVDEKEFHFSYEDRTSSENIDNVDQYDDIFQKYANMYGLDVNLLKAIACQESGGNHYGHLGNGPAEGIMQIEKSVHIGEIVTAYNFETGENDYFEVTAENLQDIDFNIRVAAIDLRNAMEAFNYNIPQGTQAYNLGIGGMNQVLANCCRNIGVQQSNLENDPTNNSWLNYTGTVDMGDSEYIGHVFSYLKNNTTLSIKDRDGTNHNITIVNDYQKQAKK